MAERDIWHRSFDARDLDPTEAGEDYMPEISNIREIRRRGTRTPDPLAVRLVHTSIAAAEARAEREAQPTSGELLRGMAYGAALSIPLWFGLVMVALWLAQP